MIKKLAILLFAVLTLAISTHSAFALLNCSLGPPDSFYGTLKINDANAEVGTELRGAINGEERGNYTTTVEGQYGQQQGDDKLYVQCDNFGDLINFEIKANNNWVDTGESATCKCGNIQNVDINADNVPIDNDQDGFASDVDCNDNDPNINPGQADSACNGIDNDCDLLIDEDYVQDTSCFLPGACSADNSASSCVNGIETLCSTGIPAANDASCNNIDDDCDALTDEDYVQDTSCFLPGACAAENAASSCAAGVETACSTGTGTTEVCDGSDNDCDGSTDEEVLITFYEDADGDTYGNAGVSQLACFLEGYVQDNQDCDDTNPSINPGAAEVCNGVDDNCNGQIDEGGVCAPPDADGDGVPDADDNCPDASNPNQEDADNDGIGDACDACTDADVDGFCLEQGPLDCNDNNAAINPDAIEVCDTLDNDCDEQVDEGDVCACTDIDQDGVCDDADNCPNAANPNQEDTDNDEIGDVCDACTDADSDGFCEEENDCDDTDTQVNLNSAEVCDGIDNNCDGIIDENVQETWYEDSDSDGYGNADVAQLACFENQPEGFIGDNTDCNDANANVNPGAVEVCNQVDDNCDGNIDEGDVCAPPDADGDGVPDAEDNCPNVANPDQIDLDNDGIGFACDEDTVDVYNASIQIYNGWTLFALPYNPIGIDNSEELGQDIMNAGNISCDVVMMFDGNTQLWDDDVLGLGDPSFSLSGTQGYFINCDGSFEYTYQGTLWS